MARALSILALIAIVIGFASQLRYAYVNFRRFGVARREIRTRKQFLKTGDIGIWDLLTDAELVALARPTYHIKGFPINTKSRRPLTQTRLKAYEGTARFRSTIMDSIGQLIVFISAGVFALAVTKWFEDTENLVWTGLMMASLAAGAVGIRRIKNAAQLISVADYFGERGGRQPIRRAVTARGNCLESRSLMRRSLRG